MPNRKVPAKLAHGQARPANKDKTEAYRCPGPKESVRRGEPMTRLGQAGHQADRRAGSRPLFGGWSAICSAARRCWAPVAGLIGQQAAGCGATRRHPGTLRLQTQGSYPAISISWCWVWLSSALLGATSPILRLTPGPSRAPRTVAASTCDVRPLERSGCHQGDSTDVEGWVPGQCAGPVPTSACVAGNRGVRSLRPRPKGPRPIRGLQAGEERTGECE
jgi:hypothetical protein